MSGPSDILIVDGHAFSWRRLCEIRREQVEAWRKARAEQQTLFPLIADCRPAAERTASGRYLQPTFLDAAGILATVDVQQQKNRGE